ncbi:oxaloacetate decarboxylase [Salmonella enterica subsp. enterica serovar Typhimurium str. DT104]|nr:oxaloacetate decarboxylase [Salmonella enterica subsp. enterica serovar Typhimurium str. DT104]
MTVAITDVVLRDAHQSLFATRLRLDDMLPIAAQLDDVGYGSLECWGGATFDACIRFLGEDPWLRLRELKKAMPKTPLQMLLRGQNLLGYRHYADDVVERFVERAVKNGMDVFRVFDAMNDPRNMKAALQAVRSHGAHAQGTLSYTTSPAHTLQTWLDLTEQLLETGVDSIAIKDMSGILTPMAAYELVSEIKKRFEVRLHLHCHATTGMAEMTLLKAIEAGVDGVDTAISSMSATYGHPATEALVATLAGTEHDTGLDILKLENIAAYFREVRKKYHAFEGQLKGYDSRILVAQVPGGMLTNLESQLKQQNAADKLDQVLAEIPRVREDLGFIPLVTPTSQIVGTQAVLNVLTGERYKTIAKETAGILKGEYGHTPVPVNAALQARVLEGGAPVTCRPADLLKPELAELEADVRRQAQEKGITLAGNAIDDVLTVALFPQIGLKFLENRNNPAAFEPLPQAEAAQPVAKAEKPAASGIYTVEVEGKAFVVKVHDTGLDILKLENIAAYFREVRKKYHAFEGQLKGYDSRILVAQVPGGMLTNLESQLKQQNAADKLDQVLAEIPRVREDLGFIPLVTPTSQIVGTQAVLNVLTGERYKTIAKETAGILKGEYGHTPVPVNAALQARVLEGGAPVTCRPADLLKPELAELEADVRRQAQEKGITLAGNAIDDVLTVALFPQIGLKFLENRNNPAAFEPLPQAEAAQPVAKAEKPAASGIYTVEVEGKAFVVKVSDGGDISQLTAAVPAASSAPVQAAAPAGAGTPVTAPLAGNIWKVIATEGQTVAEGDVLLILEAMKMETEIRAAQAGTVRGIAVKSGDAVSVGDTLMTLA